MLENLDQFYIFVSCVAIGGFCGLFFSLSRAIKYVFGVKIGRYLGILFDICAFVLTTLTYVRLSYVLNFPNFRFYMAFGVIIGLVAYLKSFHFILAKIGKKIYNIITDKIKTDINSTVIINIGFLTCFFS